MRRTTTQRNHAVRTEIDGIKFGSGGEAHRYQELTLMERAGEIEDLTVHPSFPLVINGKVIKGPGGRPGRAEFDFSYIDVADRSYHVEDYKGRTDGDEYKHFWLKKEIIEATLTGPDGKPIKVEVVQ